MNTGNGFFGIKSGAVVSALCFLVGLCVMVGLPASASAAFDHIFVAVNGDSTLSTMTQGDVLSWGSNCDLGATVNFEIWFDVNSNGTIEPATDFFLTSENITDGNPVTEIDAMLDGYALSETIPLYGEPGDYIFKATELALDSSLHKVVSVVAVMFPPNQFSGQIILPGVAAPNSLLANHSVFAESEDGAAAYFGLTNSMGMYSMPVGNEGTGFEFYLASSSVPGFVPPGELMAIASGTVGSLDFTYEIAADSVYGFVRDGSGSLLNFETQVAAESFSTWRSANTSGGRYVVYFSDTDDSQWELEMDSRLSPLYLTPDRFQFNLDILGSFPYDISLIDANAFIYARITEEGGLPSNQYRIFGYSLSLSAGAEAVSGVGTDNVVAVPVSTLDPNNWYLSLNQQDDEFPIPYGYVVDTDHYGIAPGDTVDFNLIIGHLLSGTVNQDAGDGPIDWDDVWVGANQYGANPDGSGNFDLFVSAGFYSVGVWADNYLTTPQSHDILVTGDVSSGLDFTINETHCRVTGTLQNVSLPLLHEWNTVTAGTGVGPLDGYYAFGFVDQATGTYELFLCDGDWTITPPYIDGAPVLPTAAMATIGERPDSVRTIDFDYGGSTSCCEGHVGDVNGEGGDEPTIGDIAVLVDALYITLDWSPIPCLLEADINQSGGANPVSGEGGDITIGDVSLLVDRLFITNDWTLLPDCL